MEVRRDRYNKTLFLPSSGRFDTAIWMHYIDANKTDEEKAWRQLHKNAVTNIEQDLEAAPQKAGDVLLPTTHHEDSPNYTNQICETLLVKLRRAHKGCTSHGRAKVGQPARTYIQQLYADTGCSREDLLEAMDNCERGSEISVLMARQDDIYTYIYAHTHIYIYIHDGLLTLWVECLPMVRNTWVQSSVTSYQRL